MKKILYITLLLIICISCDSYVEKINIREQREQELYQQSLEKHITDTTFLEDELYNIKFDGHLYVVYREKDGYGFGAAMVHSPNCKCNKQ